MGSVQQQRSTAVHNHEAEAEIHHQINIDAGALFVLKSKGSWMHSGYHLTAAICGPALLSIPYAFVFLGWTAGIVCLVMVTAVSFYSYYLMSLVLEHHADLGRRHLRFTHMARDILGAGWGRYYVGPIQFLICYGAPVYASLLGGISIKAIYLLAHPNGSMKLYEFVVMFGCLLLILAQIPSFHSLRHLNLISLFMGLAYSACATVGSIYIGLSSKGPQKDYSLKGDLVSRLFGVFNAIAIIATTYGNALMPEIQATIAPPVKGKMFKGLCVCYAVAISTFFSVAISGYWAFGNESASLILTNFSTNNAHTLLPKWFIIISYVFMIAQLSAVGVVYMQPLNELLERAHGDPKSPEFSARNVIPRLISRSLCVISATFLAAMLPFFGDLNAFFGAFGFIPLDFILPMIFYNFTFKPSIRTLTFWLNLTIALLFSAIGIISQIAALRQIVLDAKTYRLFANV